ncbi:MAG: (d)CMP kinase [Spirochaetia bacterium]
MVVAIDGPAGSGKSVVSQRVAKRLGFHHLNSGKLYRAITYQVLHASGATTADREKIVAIAESAEIYPADGGLSISGRFVPDAELHGEQVDGHVSAVSSVLRVRELVNAALRSTASKGDIVVEGRDITTVVFPDAEVKVYLDADIDSRAKRRYAQQAETTPKEQRSSYEDIRRAIAERDQADRTKEHGALLVAPDALYLDTSHLTIDEVCDKVTTTIQSDKIQQEI